MGSFIKENLVLITGIALPLLLTLIFFAATLFDKVIVDPPRHNVIFTTNYNYHNNSNAPYRLHVKDDAVHFTYIPPKENEHRNWQKPRLFVYDPIIDNTREIELPLIEDPEVKMTQVITDFKGRNINTLQTSPDGYRFEYEYRRNGNLMTELFGGGSRSRSHYALRKNGNKVKIHSATGYYYNAKFIAWVLNDQEVSNDR